ncbi:S41 family peptidase [Pedobacter sp. GR22-10]|uniref:S41 family peptidase n=1 Tax=Pedobacter sp. GR22-10 TaxID=2994472 RepID=UPI002245208E|nr:S41 family peptidase [Pedobacter sp. GR22-10]MCX2431633.1 S41 family peptidase [Pedobacter sp. GR22-10]
MKISFDNRMFKKLGVLIIFIIKAQIAISQTQPIYYDDLNLDIFYDLAKVRSLKSDPGFYFPEYEFFEDYKLKGITLVANRPNNFKDSIWRDRSTTKLKLKKDTSVFFMKYMVENINTINICVYQDGVYWYKEFVINEQGYQIPINEKITNWKRCELNPIPAAKIHLTERGNLIVSMQCFSDKTKASRLVTADLLIHDQISVKKSVNNSFFNQALEAPTLIYKKYNKYYSSTIISGSKEETDEAQRSNIYLQGLSDRETEINVLTKIITTALDRYPFYQERQLDKVRLRAKYQSLIQKYNDTQQICKLIDELKKFLSEEFKDPHLQLLGNTEECKEKPDNSKKPRRPFNLYQINGQLFVAMVNDQRYSELLPIGSKVLSIDGKSTDTLLKKAFPFEAKQNSTKEFFSGIAKPAGDSTVLLVNTQIGPRLVTVKYDGEFKLRSGSQGNYDFKVIKSNVAYVRLSSWTLDVYTRFINDLENINKSKKLILDLRGNGGGAALSVFRLLSLMVNHNSELYETLGEDSSNRHKTVIKSNNFRHIRGEMPILVLGDRNTACASEMFIQSLKYNRDNVKVIATENTAGVLASRFDIHFPSGITFSNNCFTSKMIFPKVGCLENVGISPDIKVMIKSVFDLKPYNDVVLQSALIN